MFVVVPKQVVPPSQLAHSSIARCGFVEPFQEEILRPLTLFAHYLSPEVPDIPGKPGYQAVVAALRRAGVMALPPSSR